MFIRFDRIHKRDRQTDRRTDTAWRHNTIRYDSVCLTCSKKLTGSQLSLPHIIGRACIIAPKSLVADAAVALTTFLQTYNLSQGRGGENETGYRRKREGGKSLVYWFQKESTPLPFARLFWKFHESFVMTVATVFLKSRLITNTVDRRRYLNGQRNSREHRYHGFRLSSVSSWYHASLIYRLRRISWRLHVSPFTVDVTHTSQWRHEEQWQQQQQLQCQCRPIGVNNTNAIELSADPMQRLFLT